VEILGGEIGTVQGPFHLMAEGLVERVNREAGDDLWLDGFYVEAGWFLTGESRPYDRKNGIFGQVKPKKNVTDGGIGAWQIAARYSMVDLIGAGTPAGSRKLSDVTVGVNWFLTQNLKVSVDWVNSNATPSTRDGGMLQARIQASF
jgi:phosphate-selective porin OprO/OprP